MPKIEKILQLGLGVGITTWILSWLYGFFVSGKSLATITFSTINVDVSQQIQSGLNTDLVSRLLQSIGGGQINFGMGIITAIVAGIAVVWLGTLVMPFFQGLKLPTGKNEIGKMTALLFFGSVAAGLIVGAFGMTLNLPALGVALAMIIYFTIVGVVYGFLASQIKALPRIE